MEHLLAVSAHCVPWPEKRAAQVNRWAGGGRTRDDGLLRARHDSHQTNEGESHHPRPSTSGRNKSGACEFIFQARRVMRVYSGHWLDYDPVALVILVVGIGAVVLLALSI